MPELFTRLNAPNGRAIDQPLGLFIDNEFINSSDGQTIDTINPFDEQKIASVFAGSIEDVDKAVRAARTAFEGSWRQTDGTARGRLLLKLADLVEGEIETLATIETLDTGKPFSSALGDIQEVYSVLRYFGGWADKTYGQTIETGRHKFTYTIRQPIGVCGQIVPWNYPLAMVSWKIGPALACGNTVVVKPSESTPLSALYFAQLVVKAGFPPGVVNFVNGLGSVAGMALVEHPLVSKVAFTGSTVTGKRIMKTAADSMKNITLETGGKSPLVIFADADIPNALKWAHYGIMGNAGQICTATSRIFVHEDIYEEFTQRYMEYIKSRSILGDPFDERTYQGPQATKAQYEKILSYAKIAKEEGARIAMGGCTAPGRPNDKGYFISPTIVCDVKPEMRVYQEEIFGPFAVLIKFKDEQEVMKLANDTQYGLGSAVFTKNITRAVRFAENIEAGMVWINANNNSDYRVPFGGVKQSGVGRELGQLGLEAYSQVKAVHLNLVMSE